MRSSRRCWQSCNGVIAEPCDALISGSPLRGFSLGWTKYGWTWKILNIDLTTGRCWRSGLTQELLHAYLGGRGLGVCLMRDYYGLDPFDPAIPLIFAVGPLCDTSAPTAARLSVVTRSPLTVTIYDCSAGGNEGIH